MKKTTLDIEKTALVVDRISRNRLILAIALVVDGVIFLLNPEKPVEGMGNAIAICMMLTAATMIIAKITAREPFVHFLPPLLLLAVGALMFFFPQGLSAYFRVILAILIMINGILNLLSLLGLNRAQETLAALEGKVGNLFSRLKRPEDLDKGIHAQTQRYIRPLQQVVSESKGHKAVSVAANLLTVIMGLLLLVRPGMSITVFGLIFIYVGINDFLLAFRTRNIYEKLRDKKFRDILLEETDAGEKQAEEKPALTSEKQNGKEE